MSTERAITLFAGLVGAVALFWFLLLSPKMKTQKDLNSQISSLTASAESAEQAANSGLAQKRTYKKSYSSLVKLGKAVPADADTPSFLTQVSGISNRAGVQLDGLVLGQSSSAAPATTTDTTGLATESTAALLPLGAQVGPAGLSVMPYDVTFSANYFQTADLLGGLDGLVHLRKPKGATSYRNPRPSGRLVTIDSFSLATEDTTASPNAALSGTLSITTYLAPPDQGLTGGATATSPLPDGSTTTTSSPSVAATVTP